MVYIPNHFRDDYVDEPVAVPRRRPRRFARWRAKVERYVPIEVVFFVPLMLLAFAIRVWVAVH